jgi:hypothetical protein
MTALAIIRVMKLKILLYYFINYFKIIKIIFFFYYIFNEAKNNSKISCVHFLCSFLIGCTNTTCIRVNHPGVKIFADGEHLEKGFAAFELNMLSRDLHQIGVGR